MMLRSRKSNSVSSTGPLETQGPVKRPAAAVKDDPKRKRGGLSDLSNVMSNTLCIDSTKKSMEKIVSKMGLKARSGNSVQSTEPKKIYEVDAQQILQKGRLPPLLEVSKEKESCKSAAEISAREVDPCSGFDFDLQNAGDPYMVPEYAFDIFMYYKHREKSFPIGDYARRQPGFSKRWRAILVDWLIEMQESFELNHETLYTAIKVLDIFMDKTKTRIDEKDLQLMGSTAVFIACKFEERCPPPVEDFLWVCENSFSSDQLLSMERRMLDTVGFDLGFPLAYRFLRRYAKVLHLDMPTLTLARYYLETCAHYYEFIGVRDSLMASACLLLSLRVKKLGEWCNKLVKYSGYRLEEVEPLMWSVNHAVIVRPKLYPRISVAFSKYSSDVFYEVARLPLLQDSFKPVDPVGPPPQLSFTVY